MSRDPLLKAGLVVFVVCALTFLGFFSYYYVKYQKILEAKFQNPIFANSAKIYAIPPVVHVGEQIDEQDIATELHRAGYTEKKGQSKLGSYRPLNDAIEVDPGPASYHSPEPATIHFTGGQVSSIAGQHGNLAAYELEPVMITSLSDSQRSKRRVVRFNQIPKVMVDAVLAIEDRRFFQHGGVNFVRFAEAAWTDFTHQRRDQGGSTLTMQLARGFFLSPRKTIKRKLTEMLIAEEMEQRFSKEQIFELYANWVDLGQRGSFTISGFAEGEKAFFNKDLKDITLPEAALLAGLIQRPSYLSPYRHPERALERRNLVLDAMVETHAITKEQAEKAKATPLKLAPPNVEASDAPYFVDLVRDTVMSKLNEHDVNEEEYRIYTTLDPDLQKAAAQAVQIGMKIVDEEVAKRRTKRVRVGRGKYETKVEPGPDAQVALVAMDPHTGKVLALVGGRNYAWSQLNHAVASRPTGSIFKPFVYATALNTGLDGTTPVLTPTSLLNDEPTTFAYGDEIYEPRNFNEEYKGEVTARYALALSLNNATVALAQQVGYDKVAALARAAGITSVQPTPAMALGSYPATPLEMASAYTVFANSGTRISSTLVDSVRTNNGDVVLNFEPEKRQVLDPRIAYMMTNMMQGVLNFGTGYTVRARGFDAPAAGKTGSSHDGWFAGYTSNLLCIVWVGFDDYSNLHLTGSETAAPIWAEFMKKAVTLPQYANPQPFPQPPGVVDVQLDKTTNLLATPSCPDDYTASFLAGTEPTQTCEQAQGVQGFFSRIFGMGTPKPLPPPGVQPPNSAAGQNGEKKKGLFGKIADIFKDDKSSNPPKPADKSGSGPQ